MEKSNDYNIGFQMGKLEAKKEFDSERITLIKEIHDNVLNQGIVMGIGILTSKLIEYDNNLSKDELIDISNKLKEEYKNDTRSR